MVRSFCYAMCVHRHMCVCMCVCVFVINNNVHGSDVVKYCVSINDDVLYVV